MTARRGVSLVEVVVGLSVIAVAALIGTATLSWTVEHRSSIPAATRAVGRAAAVRRTIATWIEGAYVTATDAPALRISDRSWRQRDDDELEFATSAGTPLGPDVVVRLYIDRDPVTDATGLAAELTDWVRGRVLVVELDSSITSLRLAARTQLLGEDQWVHSWISSVVPPRAIELRLAGERAEDVAPLLRLPITVVLGGGR